MFTTRLHVLIACLCMYGCSPNTDTEPDIETGVLPGDQAVATMVDITQSPSWVFPQRRLITGGELVLHAPQVREWPDFAHASMQVAIEYYPDGDPLPKFGTASFTSTTDVSLDQRIVSMRSIKVNKVQFSEEVPERYYDAIMNTVTREHMDVPLDLFLSYLSTDLIEAATPENFSKVPPVIHVASTSTILLFVNGEPVFAPLGESGVSVVANANWPTFRYDNDNSLYMLNRDVWLTAPALDGPWNTATALPAAFHNIAKADLQAEIRAAIPLVVSNDPVPAVIVTSKPAELIVTDGNAQLADIDGTDGLAYITNTSSPVFILENTWYFLAAGRWFATRDLTDGPWAYVEQLPPNFKAIPVDHEQATIRASVPGTSEARLAALEALLPVKKEASVDALAPAVIYAGEPKFVSISGTAVARAINTSYDILKYEGRYYLCYSGIWYTALSPVGTWKVTADVPAAIYDIPPSSPSYHVTQVKVYQSTPTNVVYTYTPGYTTSVYVVNGVAVYGTGWYYPPYVYGYAYYPYYTSYGHGTWYNPATGRYGSRSVVYGPYGGYSYTQGYNPSTGRYGYVETAWDNDEWASHGETYNPRTGIGTETSRYYDEDHGRMETEREITRGERSVSMDRTVNYNDGVAKVERETARGGSSQTQRVFKDGTLTSEGTLTTADGRTATISGEHTRSGGTTTITGSEGGTVTIESERSGSGSTTTREGTFSKDGQTLSSQTQRRGNTTHTMLESSGGGQVTSVSVGTNRTTLGQSASGDLYAGHNGQVYKKTDSGWSTYDSGAWQQMDTPDRSARTQPKDYSKSFDSRSNSSRSTMNRTATSRSSLNRDFSARQGGYRQFSQRRNLGGRSRARGGGLRGRR